MIGPNMVISADVNEDKSVKLFVDRNLDARAFSYNTKYYYNRYGDEPYTKETRYL